MLIFFIAILIACVVRWISTFIVSVYVGLEKTDEEMGKSFLFNVAVVFYIISTVTLYVSVAIILAYGVKTLFL